MSLNEPDRQQSELKRQTFGSRRKMQGNIVIIILLAQNEGSGFHSSAFSAEGVGGGDLNFCVRGAPLRERVLDILCKIRMCENKQPGSRLFSLFLSTRGGKL